jgi:beta-glucosidase
MKVYRNMTLCHIKAYQAIHRIRLQSRFSGETKVGLAHALRVFNPLSRNNPFDRLAAKIMDYLFQDALVLSMADGKLRYPIVKGAPLGAGKYYDFVGINYYTRSAVQCRGFRNSFFTDKPHNDLGWEIFPEGLSQLCKRYWQKLNAPIWITENGTCDKKDAFRTRYIYDHLYEISKLCSEGIPVQRYYHWTLMDNFEWVEGESAPFGLIRVDFETQQRTLRRSGAFYAEVCHEKGVTDGIIRKYLDKT